MEIGNSGEEMVFDDFEQTYQWICHMVERAKKRKILTATEQNHLKKIKGKLHAYVDIDEKKIDSLKRKLNYLLKNYSTYYDG